MLTSLLQFKPRAGKKGYPESHLQGDRHSIIQPHRYKVLPSHNSSKPRLRILNYPDKGVAVTSFRLGNNPFWYGVTDREIVPMLFPSPLADVPNYSARCFERLLSKCCTLL
jgi:hypothetical protein